MVPPVKDLKKKLRPKLKTRDWLPQAVVVALYVVLTAIAVIAILHWRHTKIAVEINNIYLIFTLVCLLFFSVLFIVALVPVMRGKSPDIIDENLKLEREVVNDLTLCSSVELAELASRLSVQGDILKSTGESLTIDAAIVSVLFSTVVAASLQLWQGVHLKVIQAHKGYFYLVLAIVTVLLTTLYINISTSNDRRILYRLAWACQRASEKAKVREQSTSPPESNS